MDQQMVKEKAKTLMNPCPCGSGKMFYQCCGGEQYNEIANELCICGSGKKIKDCCIKDPAAHKGM